MKHFDHIADGLSVDALAQQLDANLGLWDCHPVRTAPGGAFDQTSDIWVRFRDPAELVDVAKFGEPHFPVFYPAWTALTELHPLVWGIMSLEHASMLGGILITRIPPGSQVKPHDDRGRWHAEFFNRKIYIPIRTNPRCVNYCGDESVVMQTGSAWHFDNLQIHSVVNDGDAERITAIICLRVEV